MADLEHARAMLRMAGKDFNALVGMRGNHCLLTLLESQGAEVEKFWPLVQFTMFAVQARYEEGAAELDESIERDLEIENVRASLSHVEQMIVA